MICLFESKNYKIFNCSILDWLENNCLDKNIDLLEIIFIDSSLIIYKDKIIYIENDYQYNISNIEELKLRIKMIKNIK